MTAPKLPATVQTAIVNALAAHYEFGDVGDHWECACGRALDVDEDPSKEWHAAHQAAVVAEVITQHTTVEWGASNPGSDWPKQITPRSDGSIPEILPRKRLHARLVFPWEVQE